MTTFIKKRTVIFIVVLLMFGLLLVTYFRTHESEVHEFAERVAATWDRFLLPFRIAEITNMPPDTELVMPVWGVSVSQVEDTWGAPRPGGRKHQGQDIFADRGTPVYSATYGYVVYVGENRLGGNVVFVVGAGGRRYYYAHLQSHAIGLSEGDEVTTDTVIGYIGNTGNASTTPPHLHFAVYGEGGAINPFFLFVDR